MRTFLLNGFLKSNRLVRYGFVLVILVTRLVRRKHKEAKATFRALLRKYQREQRDAFFRNLILIAMIFLSILDIFGEPQGLFLNPHQFECCWLNFQGGLAPICTVALIAHSLEDIPPFTVDEGTEMIVSIIRLLVLMILILSTNVYRGPLLAMFLNCCHWTHSSCSST